MEKMLNRKHLNLICFVIISFVLGYFSINILLKYMPVIIISLIVLYICYKKVDKKSKITKLLVKIFNISGIFFLFFLSENNKFFLICSWLLFSLSLLLDDVEN